MTGRPTLQQWADRLAASHAEFFKANPRGERLGVVIIETSGEAEIHVMSGDRDMFIAVMRLRMKLPDVERYAFCTEAWIVLPTSAREAEHVMAQALDRRLYEHPDRTEIIWSGCVDRAGNTAGVVQQIMREPGGSVRRLRRLERLGDHTDRLGGVFTSFFD